MAQRTTSSNWARSMVAALELGGVDCRAIFAELALDYAALDDPEARFAQDAMTQLWQTAVERSGNPAIGLNMAQVIRPSAFMRIPRHPATQSTLIWPGIPRPSGHLFHGHPAGQSERSDAGVALLV